VILSRGSLLILRNQKGSASKQVWNNELVEFAGLLTEEDTFKRKAAVKCPWPTH